VARPESKSLKNSNGVRPLTRDMGSVALVNLSSGPIDRARFGAGRHRSETVKPVAGTESGQTKHVGYVVEGRLKVVADDGSELEIGPGDALCIEPGRDAWILGEETCELIDVGGLSGYTKP
jgi:mannose-6-phosphate isomerase-like protein (cupin superfamily)